MCDTGHVGFYAKRDTRHGVLSEQTGPSATKANLTEPYDFIFLNDKKDRPPPLKRAKFKTYAPIFSYYVGEKFADFGIPLSDDWASATGLVFPDTLMIKGGRVKGGTDLYSEENFKKFIKPWEAKMPTAFFRGNDWWWCDHKQPTRNQLLWHMNTRVTVSTMGKVVGIFLVPRHEWNMRDKKRRVRCVTYPRHDNFKFVWTYKFCSNIQTNRL